MWPSFDEPLGELAREGRLTGTLEAGEHDDGRRLLGELEATLLAAEDRDELVVDDLHDLLGGVQGLVDLVAEGALAHLAGELLDDLEGDVGVEQGATDLADGAVDIRRGELALAAEVAEGRGEAIREGAEGGHGGEWCKPGLVRAPPLALDGEHDSTTGAGCFSRSCDGVMVRDLVLPAWLFFGSALLASGGGWFVFVLILVVPVLMASSWSGR